MPCLLHSCALLLVLFTVLPCVLGVPSLDPTGALLSTSLIWHPGATPGDYVVARIEFTPPSTLIRPSLAIFADSRYILWWNGQRLSSGPERFDWRAPTYDTIPLASHLIPNATNALVILAHNYDTCNGAAAPNNMPEVCIVKDPGSWWLDTPSGRFMNHVPGLAAALIDGDSGAAVLVTSPSSSWRTSNATRYRPSRAVWAAIPDALDGRVDGGIPGWQGVGYDDRAWATPVGVDGGQWGPLTPRSVPRLKVTPVGLTVAGGSGPSPPPFPITLSSGSGSSTTLVVDAGRQVLGRYAVSLRGASHPGLVVTLTFFERRNASTGALSNTFSSTTYTCSGGGGRGGGGGDLEEWFETSDTFGGRYIEVALSAPPTLPPPYSLTLLSLNATDERYPFTPIASFTVPGEPFWGRLHAMALATLSINAGDSYTDCSTRERVEWLGDAVFNQFRGTRVGFATEEDDGVSVTYGDTRLLRGVVKRALLSSHSFYPTSFQVKAHTCSDRVDFNAVWSEYGMGLVRAVWVLAAGGGGGGGVESVRGFYPDIRALLLWLLSRVQLGTGLGLYRETVFFTDPLFLTVTCGVTMNSYAYAALMDGGALAGALGYSVDAALFSSAAAALQEALTTGLAWNASVGAFNAALPGDAQGSGTVWPGGVGGFGGGKSGGSVGITTTTTSPSPPNAYANFIALAQGVVSGMEGSPTAPLAQAVVAWLMRPENNATVAAKAPMAAIQQLTALYSAASGGGGGGASTTSSAALDKLALDIVRVNWREMVEAEDVGTLWEFFSGSQGGEVSHNMGAAPLPFLGEWVLGVRGTPILTQGGGLLQLLVEPHLGDIKEAQGVVGTEFGGPVGVAWKVTPGTWGGGGEGLQGTRAVDLQLNVSAVTSGGVNVSIALPLDDDVTPPPEGPGALNGLCLSLGGRVVNVTQGLSSGALVLDKMGRYLRVVWVANFSDSFHSHNSNSPPAPPVRWLGGGELRGLSGVDSVVVRLAAGGVGGC